ncbi:hypothetical protein HMSSN036_92020 [Paenibacillus macerans]|nr:hypothetical protein HMSSN036_92020 [Paenibacillus macerans]
MNISFDIAQVGFCYIRFIRKLGQGISPILADFLNALANTFCHVAVALLSE